MKDFLKNNSKWIIIIIISILLITGGLIIYFTNNNKYLSEKDVKNIIYKATKLEKNKEYFEFEEIKLDKKTKQYNVKFFYNLAGFEYVIDAESGKVIYNTFDNYTGNLDLIQSDYLSKKEVKEFIIKDLNANKKDVKFNKVEVEKGIEKVIYNIQFTYKKQKYYYRVDGIGKRITHRLRL